MAIAARSHADDGLALGRADAAADARRPALERTRHSQQAVDHRREDHASVLQRGWEVALYSGRVPIRSAFQQRRAGGTIVLRARSRARQLGTAYRPRLADNAE